VVEMEIGFRMSSVKFHDRHEWQKISLEDL
jgi:hypothetical protein